MRSHAYQMLQRLADYNYGAEFARDISYGGIQRLASAALTEIERLRNENACLKAEARAQKATMLDLMSKTYDS